MKEMSAEVLLQSSMFLMWAQEAGDSSILQASGLCIFHLARDSVWSVLVPAVQLSFCFFVIKFKELHMVSFLKC